MDVGYLFGFLFIVGLLIMAVGSLWLLVVAFQKSILWGLGSLFVPLVSLVFVIRHWVDAKVPFLVNLAGVAVLLAAGVGSAAMDPEGFEQVAKGDTSLADDDGDAGRGRLDERAPPSGLDDSSGTEQGQRRELSKEVTDALGGAYDLEAGVPAPIEYVWTELTTRAGKKLSQARLVAATAAKIAGDELDPKRGALLELTFVDAAANPIVQKGTPLLTLAYGADGLVESETPAKGAMPVLERPSCSLAKAFSTTSAQGISLLRRQEDARTVWFAVGEDAKLTYLDAESCVVVRR